MVKFEIIQKAKMGDENAINQILNFYLPRIKKICNDDDFVQMALITVFNGVKNFKNR